MNYDKAKATFRSVETAGALVWNCRKPGVRLGMPAGFMFNGTRYVTVEGERVQTKRIVWLLNTGTWPTCTLYHKDGNRADCRFSNLTTRRPKRVQTRSFLEIGKADDGKLFLKMEGVEICRDYDSEQIARTVRALLVY